MQKDMGCQDHQDILDRTTDKRVIPPYGMTRKQSAQEVTTITRNDSIILFFILSFTLTDEPLRPNPTWADIESNTRG